MTPEKPIYGKEGQELEKTISKLIGRHNVLCDVEEFFTKNKVANEYFKEAKDEVLGLGNQSYSSMLVIAIKNMVEFIEDQNKVDTDVEKLRLRIYDLESENRRLKTTLGSINKILST